MGGARWVPLVLAAGVVLLVALQALLYQQYRVERTSVEHTLDERLGALGLTAAGWLAGESDEAASRKLADLARANRLEDAYVVDASYRVLASAHASVGEPLNLLRLDLPRAERALAGEASVGPAYTVEGTPITAAYFPVARAGDRVLVALEAGGEFRAPAERLERAYFASAALAALVALLFAGGLAAAGRALDRAREDSARAERLADIGRMAAMVAHEVRNPLGILRGQIELLQEGLGEGTRARERERLTEMLGEIDRLAAISDELLTLGREGVMAREPVRLGPLVDDALRRTAAASTGAILETDVDAELTVLGDVARLRQALFNLVLNAAQIGGEGVTVRVSASAPPGTGEVYIRVHDDGPGVPPALRAQLFEPFVSARSGGRGLGLAVARYVAERHGGRLELEATPAGARGAVFSLRLPRAGGES